MSKYGPDVIPICQSCDGVDSTKTCKKCAVTYCAHFASTTDVRYCANCISDFALRETIMEKVVEHERPDGSISFSRKYQSRHIMITGTDWLFNCALIPEMTDSEIDATIEYHRANVGLMIQERESRKLERIRKLSGIRISNTKHETQEEREKREEKAAAKAGKKTKTKDKSLTPEQVMAALMAMVTGGSAADREKLIAALGGKK